MEPVKTHTFPKQERLTLRKHIEALFQDGEAFSFSMFRILFRSIPRNGSPAPVQVGIAVPKKKIKKAHQRNLLKRRIREAWRQNKHHIQNHKGNQLQVFIIYRSQHIAEYKEILGAMLQIIERLHYEANKKAPTNKPSST